MAGGIDWFRWHHGSVTDPKFQLVAKKAGAKVAEVIAVWACLLEAASQAPERGNPGRPDFEALDCALDLDDGKAEAIYTRMTERDLIGEDGTITAWERRQPKREDETAADRKRRQRERDRDAQPDPQRHDESRNVPPASRNVTQSHDREEESREEKEKKPTASSAAKLPTCPYDAIVGAYLEILPELPAIRVMDDERKKGIRKRWEWVLTTCKPGGERRAETPEQGVEWFRSYFELARDNDFLMGRSKRTGDHANWKCDIDFLMTTKGLKQVLERTEAS